MLAFVFSKRDLGPLGSLAATFTFKKPGSPIRSLRSTAANAKLSGDCGTRILSPMGMTDELITDLAKVAPCRDLPNFP